MEIIIMIMKKIIIIALYYHISQLYKIVEKFPLQVINFTVVNFSILII